MCRRGELGRKVGVDGDMTGEPSREPPYFDVVPAPRSGLTGKMGMPGENGILFGERGAGGSMGTGDSLRRANLTVLKGVYCVEEG